jgi:hypothetical protein
LTSGRLAAFLTSIGRADLAPDPHAPGTPDERLDAWIGRLPATKPAQPELDVHPATLLVRVCGGGGTARRTLLISNTGHRLLRATASVEPGETQWLRVAPEYAGKTIVAIDEAELSIEVTSPESYRGPLRSTLVIASNGGTRRVPVTLEPPLPSEELAPAQAQSASAGWDLRSWLARQSMPARLIGWSLTAVAVRVLIGVSARWFGSASEGTPALSGPALVMAAIGCAAGALAAVRRQEPKEVPWCGLAGGLGGILAAAIGVAAARAIEPIMGLTLAGSIIATTLLWGLIALAAAGASFKVVPPAAGREATP